LLCCVLYKLAAYNGSSLLCCGLCGYQLAAYNGSSLLCCGLCGYQLAAYNGSTAAEDSE